MMYFQVLLSKDDLRMMLNEVSGKLWSNNSEDCPISTVDLRTFLLIMENSAW
jgi:hypothetical protein